MGSIPNCQLVHEVRRLRSRRATLRVKTPVAPRWPSRTSSYFA